MLEPHLNHSGFDVFKLDPCFLRYKLHVEMIKYDTLGKIQFKKNVQYVQIGDYVRRFFRIRMHISEKLL